MTQAGGRLDLALQKHFADLAKEKIINFMSCMDKLRQPLV